MKRSQDAERADRVQEINAEEKDIRADLEVEAEEIRLGQERAHTADIEEEARRHAHGEREEARVRDHDPLRQEDAFRVTAACFDEEGRHKRKRREQDEDSEEANRAGEAAAKRGFARRESSARYFEVPPADRLGDLSLVDPDEAKRQLGPSVRFAQHAMILAHARMTNEGETRLDRAEAIRFLASLYTGLSDRAYANKALREFGPATGILDIYPLELFDHLLRFVPGFCQKVRPAPFLTTQDETPMSGKHRTLPVGDVVHLRYADGLRIRGFCIEGGARPGYVFEPGPERGDYELTVQNPGTFRILISAIQRDGWLLIDDLECTFEGDPAPPEASNSEAEAEAKATTDAEASEAAASDAAAPEAFNATPSDSTGATAVSTETPTEADIKFTIPRYV